MLEIEDVVVVELEIAAVLVGNALRIAAVRGKDRLRHWLDDERCIAQCLAGGKRPAPVHGDVRQTAGNVMHLGGNGREIWQVIVGDAEYIAACIRLDRDYLPIV